MSNGALLNIGDEVEIMDGAEQMPEHKGVTFQISEINAQDLKLTGISGKVYQGYQMKDVRKINVSQAA